MIWRACSSSLQQQRRSCTISVVCTTSGATGREIYIEREGRERESEREREREREREWERERGREMEGGSGRKMGVTHDMAPYINRASHLHDQSLKT